MPPPRPGTPILVADDEPQLLGLMARVLERAGYAVVTARDGDEALRILDADPAVFEVAVLDAAVEPRGAGEVMEALLARRGEAGVVLTSGGELAESLRDRLRARAGVFLHKPFPPDALRRAVEDARLGEAH